MIPLKCLLPAVPLATWKVCALMFRSEHPITGCPVSLTAKASLSDRSSRTVKTVKPDNIYTTERGIYKLGNCFDHSSFSTPF